MHMLNLKHNGREGTSVSNKPVYINVFTYAFPITAVISILHRISGVLTFLAIPIFLGMLQDGLYFSWIIGTTNKIVIWIILSALMYHLFAGIRHLCMDAGFGEDRIAATISSYIVLILSILFSLLIGIRLC